MSRASLRRAIVVIVASLVLAVTFSSAAGAAAGGGVAAVMLDTGDLPAGFQPDAAMTGPLDGHRAQVLGIDPNQIAALDIWVRAWTWPQRAEVVEMAVDAGTRDHAQVAAASGVAVLMKEGAARQSIAGPVRLAAYGAFVQASGSRYFELALPLARGPYYFGLHVLVPGSSAASASSLMSALAAAQMRKVPAGTPDTAPPGSLAADAAGGATGVLVGYLLGADAIAYLRNPLRPKRGQGRSARPRAAPEVVDVSSAAKKNSRTAVWRLAVQLIGLAVAAYGADVLLVRYWYAYLMTGLAIVWAGGRFIRPAGVRRGKNRAVLAGSHKVLVTGMLAGAAAAILAGLACVVLAGMYQSLLPGSTVPLVPGQAPTPVHDVVSGLQGAAIFLVAVGAITFRGARRMGSIQARRLMLRDPRPPVLYLRSFGDDQLRLWTATFGRPSLIERFTIRRFDTFEEVLVRHLSRYGPVIAVNPPGTRLAPLGAARETIDPADWQSAVAGWMAQARLIVFVAPPNQVNRGLEWELQTVAAHGYWDKTLVAVPPVRTDQLQHRWREFRGAAAGLWPFTVPGPAESPHALVLAFRNGRWEVITADRRSEWSYGAALERALGEMATFDAFALGAVVAGH